MENIMMLPASYCVMNEEEMTYTTGGASAIQAIAAWVFPPYAWLAGVTAMVRRCRGRARLPEVSSEGLDQHWPGCSDPLYG